MARDRPSPYGEGGFSPPVARGPVPRERWSARAMARDRPSPYGEGVAFFFGARGPSEVSTRASERVSPQSPSSRCFPLSVVCDRLITTRSGAGAPELQMGAPELCSSGAPAPERVKRLLHRDQEVSPTGRGECLGMSEPPPIAEYLA